MSAKERRILWLTQSMIWTFGLSQGLAVPIGALTSPASGYADLDPFNRIVLIVSSVVGASFYVVACVLAWKCLRSDRVSRKWGTVATILLLAMAAFALTCVGKMPHQEPDGLG